MERKLGLNKLDIARGKNSFNEDTSKQIYALSVKSYLERHMDEIRIRVFDTYIWTQPRIIMTTKYFSKVRSVPKEFFKG